MGARERVEAIVIGGLDYGEADRIVHLLSPTRGRFSVMARRIRSAKRKTGGGLDTGNRVIIQIRTGRGNLPTLDQMDLRDGRIQVRKDLDRIALLAYAVEICGHMAREHHPEPRLYGLLETAALILDASHHPPKSAFRGGLEAKTLTFSGFLPVLTRCATCEGPLSERMGWSHRSGGAIHHHCGTSERDVSREWLVAVENARRTPLKDLVDVELPKGSSTLLAETIEAHLGRAIRSRGFLETLQSP